MQKFSPLVLCFFAFLFLVLPQKSSSQCLGFGRRPPRHPDAVVAHGFQKAFIYHANGVERIVLQPSYTGLAKDFGVFLAVPEIPLIEKAPEGVFSELDRLTRPPPPPQVASAKGNRTLSAESSWHGVSVIQKKIVGIYEATVLQASDQKSFTDWLQMNGYNWPKEVEPIFDHYVRARWFFVAMKVNRDVPKETRFAGPITPISVRFTQDEILMPMKLTSLTPGGTDFIYYLVTDSKIKAKNINENFLKFSAPLSETNFMEQKASFPLLTQYLKEDTLRTRQDNLADELSDLDQEFLEKIRQRFENRLYLTKYQGHFNREDLGEDFVWNPVPPGRLEIEDSLDGLSPDVRKKVIGSYQNGMRRVKTVKLKAEVYDTNEGYGKPTFINGIQVGDLAAIGQEGSDRWQTIEMKLPHSVVHWLGDQIDFKVENYGMKKPGKSRMVDAYNIRNIQIVVHYDNGATWNSKTYDQTRCSVPQWRNCQGQRVKKWGDPVVIRF